MELNVQGLQYFTCDIIYTQGSPGNLQQFEDILFTSNDVSMAMGVIAVKVANKNWSAEMIGVSYIDPMLWKLGVCQFSDSEQLSNVEV